MLEACCYLEEEAECKEVPKSLILPREPSRSLPAHWQLHRCLLLGRNMCVCAHTCVSVCVAKMHTTQPSVVLPRFIS